MPANNSVQNILIRRLTDESTIPHSRRFLIQVEPTLQSLQSQEDTDGNMQITIEDNGPKVRGNAIKGLEVAVGITQR